LIASLLFVSVLILVSFANADESSFVVDLNADNFDQYVGKSTPAFVEFYAPWCGHCKKLAPEYEIVAKAFSPFKSQVTVAKVNCDAHKDLCGRFDIKGYPSLRFFKADSLEPENYSGARDADGLVQFINSQANVKAVVTKPAEPISNVVVLTDENFDQIVMDSSKGVFVEFYAPWCGHCKTLAPHWDRLSYTFSTEPNVVIAKLDATENSETAKKYDVSGYPTLLYFPSGVKNPPMTYGGDRSYEDLVRYVNRQAKTFRSNDGRLTAKAGRIPAVDKLVSALLSSESQQTIIDEVKSVVNTLTDHPSASMYLKLAEKVAKSGKQYVENEIARLTKMLDFGALTPAKKDEFSLRTNLLRSFIEPFVEETEEKKNDADDEEEDDEE